MPHGQPSAPADQRRAEPPVVVADEPAPGSPAALTDGAPPALRRPRGKRRRQSARQWFAELVKFGFVGALAYVVDAGLFNLLLLGPGQVLGEQPVMAKVVSASVATLVAWMGNRYWTFSGTKRASRSRELAMFALVNVGGMGVAVLTLWVSHYVLGFTSPLADNVAANVVGVGLGTVFRYLCYRYVVFTGARQPSPAAQPGSAPSVTTSPGLRRRYRATSSSAKARASSANRSSSSSTIDW